MGEIIKAQPADKSWWVYMIRTDKNQLYTGITNNLNRRWRQHCGEIKGGAKYFRSQKPQEICYREGDLTRSQASRREAQIKQFSRVQKDQLLLESSQ